MTRGVRLPEGHVPLNCRAPVWRGPHLQPPVLAASSSFTTAMWPDIAAKKSGVLPSWNQ